MWITKKAIVYFSIFPFLGVSKEKGIETAGNDE
jgi:hypothetical protein